MNRRDVLKLFGIGAAVVPILDGKPLVEAPAQLITAPEVKILEPPQELVHGALAMTNMFNRGENVTMHVRFTSKDGVVDFSARTFISHMNYSVADVTTYGAARRHIPTLGGALEWELRGQILEEVIKR